MASAFVSGPVFVYIGVNGQQSPLFLGTGETGPKLDHSQETEPLMNDLAGSKLPLDLLDMGEMASISITFTRWNEAVMARLEKMKNIAAKVAGTEGPTDRGSLFITEGLTWELWLLYGHRNKPVMVAANMPAGRHYFYTIPEGITTLPGRRANRKQVTWTALGGYDAAAGGTFDLFDTDMSSVANIRPD